MIIFLWNTNYSKGQLKDYLGVVNLLQDTIREGTHPQTDRFLMKSIWTIFMLKIRRCLK